MKTIKIEVKFERYITCPICNRIIDTWTGNSCSHLQKIIIRKDKKHIAIFKTI